MRYLLSFMAAAMLAAPVCAASAYAAEEQTPAQGGFQGPGAGGGFKGPVGAVQADTVAKAQAAYHKAPVVLTGKIVERVGGTDDKYIFQDETGKLMVDIDHKVFAGRDIGPQTKVRLFGKVKKSAKKPLRVDVRVLQLLPQ